MSASNSKTGSPVSKTVTVAGAKGPTALAQPLLVDVNGNLLVAGTLTVTNPSVGVNGQTAPTSSNEVGGIGADGNLHGISTDNSGNQNVNVISSVLPTGAATSALQTSGNTSLTTIATNSGTQATAANQVTGNNSLTTIATNTTGVSTAALQTSGNASLTTIATNSGTQATAANQTSGNASLTTIATNSGTQATAANQTATQGSAGAGTAATKSDLVGGLFNTTLPTLTTGQQSAIQLDSSGRQILGTSSAVIGSISTVSTVTAVTTITNPVSTKSPVNANGSILNATLTGTTATTTACPANCVGFIFESESTNTDNVRWYAGVSAVASTTAGALSEPGRDSGFVPIGLGASVSVCAVTSTGTNKFSIQWVLSA